MEQEDLLNKILNLMSFKNKKRFVENLITFRTAGYAIACLSKGLLESAGIKVKRQVAI